MYARRADFPLKCPGSSDSDTASFDAKHRIIRCDSVVKETLVSILLTVSFERIRLVGDCFLEAVLDLV